MDLIMRNTPVTLDPEELTANTPTAIEWPESDERMILAVDAASSTTLTVKAGNGIQGVNDLVLNIAEGTTLIKLESGRFKNVSGTNKGKIVIESAGTPGVCAVALV